MLPPLYLVHTDCATVLQTCQLSLIVSETTGPISLANRLKICISSRVSFGAKVLICCTYGESHSFHWPEVGSRVNNLLLVSHMHTSLLPASPPG